MSILTDAIYLALGGLERHILTSKDGGKTFQQVKVGLDMQQKAVCGLGSDKAVVFGRVGTTNAYQFAGPNNLSGIGFPTFEVNDCDIFGNPFTGDINGLAVGDGGRSSLFGFRRSEDPQYPGLFFTQTTPLGGQLNDVDCGNCSDDEIILSLGERRARASPSAVCRAAGRDQDGKGVLLSATYPLTAWTTLLRTDLPFQSVSFSGPYGAARRQDGLVYTTEDGGAFWTGRPSPAGSIPRRVAVLPLYASGGVILGPRVMVIGQDGIRYFEFVPPPGPAISKEGPAQVAAGGEVPYTLRVTNTGGTTAYNVVVSDTISADHDVVDYQVEDPALWLWVYSRRSSQTSRWSFFALGPQRSRTITYTVLLTNGLQAGDLVTNRAEVTATGDLNLANNTAVVTATVQGGGGPGGRPDMEATKAGPRTVVAGQPFTYTLLAVNVGTEKATNVWLIDALPAQVRFLGADFLPTAVLTPTIRWLAGWVDPGAVTRIAVRAELNGTVAAGTVLTNSLFVSAADDANPLNDQAQVTTTVATVAPTPSAAQPVSGTIGARGGTLTSQEGSYALVVPRRAFSSPLALSLEPQTPPPATERSIPVAAFSLTAQLGAGTVAALDRPITVEVKYSDAGLTEEKEQKLKLYRKTASGAFLELPTQVDIVNNIARATLDHLSEFVLQALERVSVYLPFLAR